VLNRYSRFNCSRGRIPETLRSMYYKARTGVYDTILYRKGRRNRLWWIAFISFGAGGTVVKEPRVDRLKYWAVDGDCVIIAMFLDIIRNKL
jgi:hypothetical protein